MSDPLGERLDSIERKFDDHFIQEAEERKTTIEVLTLLRRQIFGNGEVGIAERVRVLERVAMTYRKLVWIIGVGVAGLVGSLLWEMVTWFIANKATTD